MADQVEWSGERVARWLARADGLAVQLAPISDVLLRAAAPQPGERALDVGCGHGPTTREVAECIGTEGAVTGIDIAGPMLDAAAGIPTASGSAPITWTTADVETWEPTPAHFDLVLSRFGVMFFDDPVRAFANLAAATRAGGRLAIATWARRERVELFDLPYRVACRVAERAGEEPPHLPVDEGPYSLGAAEDLRTLLETAGWGSISIDVFDLVLPFGGGLGPRDAAVEATGLGPVRLVLDPLPHLRDAVVDALTRELEDHRGADGTVELRGRVLVTTARRG